MKAVLTAVLFLALLLADSVFTSEAKMPDCISPTETIVLHIHVAVLVMVDVGTFTDEAAELLIHKNIGITGDCIREIHTHDRSGVLHIETTKPGKELTLGDFLDLYKLYAGEIKNFDGTDPLVVINKEARPDYKDVVLTDGMVVIMFLRIR